jgi:hypothetical protein
LTIEELNKEIKIYKKKLQDRKSFCNKTDKNPDTDTKCKALFSKIMELKRKLKSLEMELIKKSSEMMKRKNNNGRKQYEPLEKYI